MAQKVNIVLVDDLDGSEGTETIAFALDGKSYEVDLSDKNSAKLRKALDPFIAVARKSSGSPRRGRKSDTDPSAIREWAQAQGIEVSSRGRIPASVVDQYKAAN